MKNKFFFINLDKLKEDKDYFIVVFIFNLTLYAVPIKTLANQSEISMSNINVTNSISMIVCFTITLIGLVLMKKDFKN